jgi:asparagine synthase (glutamine-hydrolysing)
VCGIAGWIRVDNAEERRARVSRMIALQAHRGPDASGIFHDEDVTLGHARLSIIDPQEHSNQPFASSDGRYVASFNGEIYNHAELRACLAAAGAAFRTTSDTEVLLEAYRAYGAACLERFEGMFSFAIWDRASRTLFCARDRLGEKPFYYAWTRAQGFVFGSELAAVAGARPDAREIDETAFQSFLSTAYSKSPATLLAGIRQLPAGHGLLLKPGATPEVFCYWSPVDVAISSLNGPAGDTDSFLSQFDNAVKLCTTADVPFGAFLSGGIDSSTVVGSVVKQGLSGNRFATYTLDYRDASFSERATAQRTAQALKLDARFVPYEEFEDQLPAMVRLAADVPLADPSFLPLFIVGKSAGAQFKVMLGGDGGDELLFGYDTYRATSLSQMLRRFNLASVLPLLSPFIDRKALFAENVSLPEKIWRLMAYHVPGSPIRSHLAWRTIFNPAEIGELRPGGASSGLDDWLLRQIPGPTDWPHDEALPLLVRAVLVDYCSWLSDGVLRKLDSALMYSSVEGRAPFLNHRLIEAGFRLPDAERRTLARGKLPLRRRLDEYGLAHVNLDRKRGFGFPLDRLFRTTLRELLFDELGAASCSALFRPEPVARYLREHDEQRANHGRKLYCLLILTLWHRRLAAGG